jgi:hypothetical protein
MDEQRPVATMHFTWQALTIFISLSAALVSAGITFGEVQSEWHHNQDEHRRMFQEMLNLDNRLSIVEQRQQLNIGKIDKLEKEDVRIWEHLDPLVRVSEEKLHRIVELESRLSVLEKLERDAHNRR